MNTFQKIKAGVAAGGILKTQWRGQPLAFRKLGADTALKMRREFIAGVDGKGIEENIAFLVELLAVTLVDTETLEPDCDSAEGRAMLGSMPVGDLSELAELAADHCGLGDKTRENAKKNLAETTTALPCDLPETSADPTPITSLPS